MTTLFNLKPGQDISIKKGFGLVPVAELTSDTIASVTETYVITATGILLTEIDIPGLYTYMEVKKPGDFLISAKARRLQEALLLPLEAPYVPIDER